MLVQNIEDPIGALVIGLMLLLFGGVAFVIAPGLHLWYADTDEDLGCTLMAELMRSKPMRILHPIVSRIAALLLILFGLWVIISTLLAL